MIGYCVAISPKLASFRLRVLLPSKYVGPCVIGGLGDVTFFYKNGNPDLAKRLTKPIVYDVVNAHFDDPDYRRMCDLASVVTCSSEAMRGIIRDKVGKDSVVIPDPYENAESEPGIGEGRLLWFGHEANLSSLNTYADLMPDISTGNLWSPSSEARLLSRASMVFLTGNNPGASANRPIKAIRAGRFVIAPEGCPESWRELKDFMWIGDAREGIRWAFANREEACRKVQLGQNYVRTRFSPQSIGSQWADLFASISGQDISTKTVGSVLTSP